MYKVSDDNYALYVFLHSLYLAEGFLHLQNLVGMSIIEWVVSRESPNYTFEEIPVNTKVTFVSVMDCCSMNNLSTAISLSSI